MVDLAQLYRLQAFNTWVLKNLPEKIHSDALKMGYGDRSYENIDQMEETIFKLERKLSAEQLVVAHTKAEKDALKLIEEEKSRHGWGSWLGSMIGYQYQRTSAE